MSAARSTHRYAVFLLCGSLLVVSAVIANEIYGAAAVPQAGDSATGEAAALAPDQPAFDKWVHDSESADGKGRLIGEIERDGKIVELRQLSEGPQADQGSPDMPPEESAPDQGEIAP